MHRVDAGKHQSQPASIEVNFGRFRALIRWVALIILLIALGLSHWSPAQHQHSIGHILVDDHYDPSVLTTPSYRQLFRAVSAQPINSALRPVHIFRDGRWHCSGTAAQVSATREVVITSAHAFLTSPTSSHYSYRRLAPFSPTCYNIESATTNQAWPHIFGREPDVLECRVGQSTLIKGFIREDDVDLNVHSTVILKRLVQPLWVVSLTTGKRYHCLCMGYDTKNNFIHHLVFAYPSLPAESGAGFLVEGWPNIIVVLGGTMEINHRIEPILSPVDQSLTHAAYGYVLAYTLQTAQGIGLYPIPGAP